MSYSNRRLSFQVRHRDSTDKVILVIALLLGVGVNIVFKVIGLPSGLPGALWIWLPAIFSGIVIVLYAIIVAKLPRAQMEMDQVGDNAYYLGFIMTLISLALTLYNIARHEGDADYIRDVVSGFGIALISTIVGVAVRTVCLQYRFDIVAREREARIAINDAIRQFRSQVTDVIRGVKHLGVEIDQSLREHHAKWRNNDEARSKAIQSEMVVAFEKALQPMSKTIGNLASDIVSETEAAVMNARDARERSLAELRESIEKTVSDLTQSAAQISEAAQRSLQASSRQIDSLTSAMKEQIQSALEEVEGGSADLRGVVTEVNKKLVNDAATAVGHALTSLVEELRQVADEMNPASEALKTATRAMEGHAGHISGIMSNYEKQGANFATNIGDIAKEISRALETQAGQHREMLKELKTSKTNLSKEISSLTRAISEVRDKEASAVAETISRTLAAQAEHYQKLVETLKASESELSREISFLTIALSEFRKNFPS